jgi:hypothetical protein
VIIIVEHHPRLDMNPSPTWNTPVWDSQNE